MARPLKTGRAIAPHLPAVSPLQRFLIRTGSAEYIAPRASTRSFPRLLQTSTGDLQRPDLEYDLGPAFGYNPHGKEHFSAPFRRPLEETSELGVCCNHAQQVDLLTCLKVHIKCLMHRNRHPLFYLLFHSELLC